MTVYVVKCESWHSCLGFGYSILDVFSSRENAEKYIEDCKQKPQEDEWMDWVTYEIVEFIVK